MTGRPASVNCGGSTAATAEVTSKMARMGQGCGASVRLGVRGTRRIRKRSEHDAFFSDTLLTVTEAGAYKPPTHGDAAGHTDGALTMLLLQNGR